MPPARDRHPDWQTAAPIYSLIGGARRPWPRSWRAAARDTAVTWTTMGSEIVESERPLCFTSGATPPVPAPRDGTNRAVPRP
jgi:hypothetical protein